jgi:hypothetical protein
MSSPTSGRSRIERRLRHRGRYNGPMGLGRSPWRVVLPCALLAAMAPARAFAQSGAEGAKTQAVELDRVFTFAPELIESLLAKGHAEFFQLIDDVQLFHLESEIDRYVGDPRDLNDSTAYKLSLLPFHIQYPIYRSLVDQMTRLDNVRSRRIYMVTPGSVRLIDLQIQPVATLEAMTGLGAGAEVESSLLTQFSARETADLGVFLLAQQPLFPETDEGWERVKHRIAKGAVPVALGALGTGAAFDAGALNHSGTFLTRGDSLRLGWYGGFRSLGVHLHPELRGGLTVATRGLEAAAGLADQVRPTPDQQDRAFELAVRAGSLNQTARLLGVDAFVEGAVSRAIETPAGFTGDRTTTRGGLFFRRDDVPALPNVALRGSAEVESNLQDRLHMTAAVGWEHPPSGLTTMVQASRELATNARLEDDRLTAFLAGSTEPIAAGFAEEMQRRARQVEVEWEGLEGIERRRADWEQRLVGGAALNRTPEEAQRELRDLAQMIAEHDDRLERLASALAGYLESRRRAYRILGWGGAPDDLHGPLEANVMLAARSRVLDRLTALSKDLEVATSRLEPLRARRNRLDEQILLVEARDLHDPSLPGRRQARAALERDWEVEAVSVRRRLDAYDHFRAEARRILAAGGPDRKSLRRWDTLSPTVKRRVAWLSCCVQP